MNNESIGPGSQDNTYEHPDIAPEMTAHELAAYASASLEQQCALDEGQITLANLREDHSVSSQEIQNATGDFGGLIDEEDEELEREIREFEEKKRRHEEEQK
jgi:hypothetical protein